MEFIFYSILSVGGSSVIRNVKLFLEIFDSWISFVLWKVDIFGR